MSSTIHSVANASDGPENTPTFFGIPAELRNAVYGHTFATETKSGFTPHPLTQVNRQIRHESLALYYASVTYLRIPTQTLEQIANTRKWLKEVDLTVYPVLPTLEFSLVWMAGLPPCTIYFTREERRPAEELPGILTCGSKRVEWGLHDSPGEVVEERALTALYQDCLGFMKVRFHSSLGRAPVHFRQVVDEGETWITRRLHLEGPPARGFNHNVAVFQNKLRSIATYIEGHDWNKSNLLELVRWFESKLLSRERE